ncbi:hypothetical protein GQR36_14005 [Enterococcus termitis]
MKKFTIWLFFLMIVNGLFVGSTVEATVKSVSTDVGIVFTDDQEQTPIVPKLPSTPVHIYPSRAQVLKETFLQWGI